MVACRVFVPILMLLNPFNRIAYLRIQQRIDLSQQLPIFVHLCREITFGISPSNRLLIFDFLLEQAYLQCYLLVGAEIFFHHVDAPDLELSQVLGFDVGEPFFDDCVADFGADRAYDVYILISLLVLG